MRTIVTSSAVLALAVAPRRSQATQPMLRARRRPVRRRIERLAASAGCRRQAEPADGRRESARRRQGGLKDKCTRCHGLGHRRRSRRRSDHREDMDLTGGKRADRNSDGVVFYTGRTAGAPKMRPSGTSSPNSKSGPSSLIQTLRRK